LFPGVVSIGCHFLHPLAIWYNWTWLKWIRSLDF
jgi:hypothetical protein